MDTFFWHRQLATLGDLDGALWLVSLTLWNVLNGLNDFITLENFAEDNVLAVEMSAKPKSAYDIN